MDTTKLDRNLDQILQDFASETRMLFSENSKEPASIEDISDLAKQTFYALNSMKKEIIDFLNNN